MRVCVRRLSLVALIATVAWLFSAFAALADDARTSLRGTIYDGLTGLPIANASIRLTTASGETLARARSDARGTFQIVAPPAQARRLFFRAVGYDDGDLIFGEHYSVVNLHLAMTRTVTFHEIGRATTRTPEDDDRGADRRLPAARLAATGALRITDTMSSSPGFTIVGDGLAPGGDAYVSLRGFRASEGQALLDGHPIGPLGVSQSPPDADGIVAGFNYQDAPYFALRSVNATFGSTALPAFGVTDIGGSVDLLTVTPTRSRETSLEQAIGNQGRSFTAIRVTGTSGALGYALAYAVSGTYGLFPGDRVAQTGLRGTDVTAATLQNVTYAVSGDYVLRNELLKVVYKPIKNFSISATAYDATSWIDKTGEGDNDLNPYAYTLANAPIGTNGSCPLGVTVSSDSAKTCLTAKSYAQAASGPAGGGPNASQALRSQDYDLRFAGKTGALRLSLDAFSDDYALVYHRGASAISSPDDFLDRWSTVGASLEAALPSRNNLPSVKIASLAQVLNGDASDIANSAITFAPARRAVSSAFLDDVYAPNVHLAVDGSALITNASKETRLLPRLSVTYRPDASDTLRVAAGRTTEDPSLENARVNLLPIGAINPDCGAIALATPSSPAVVNIGSGPAANLHAENAVDMQLDYTHIFGAFGDARLTLYDANISERIVSGQTIASSQVLGSEAMPLNARIASFCGVSPNAGAVNYTIDRLFNAASARAQGVEFTGTMRIARHLNVGYAYDVQTSVLNGIGNNILQSDPTLVNGAQAFGIPRNKATIDLHYSTGSLEVRLGGHAVGQNNPQQLPGYAYADASIEGTISPRASLDLEIGNLFNSHAQKYGLVGLGIPYATNRYFSDLQSPFVQPFNERYGLEPTNVTASVTLHI